MSGALHVLRSYTAQFDDADYDEANDVFLPHKPINAADATELVQKWQSGSVLLASHTSKELEDGTWTALQMLADDYSVPIDEFLGAVWFVSQHNEAYKLLPRVTDQIGCAVGEVMRVLSSVRLVERSRMTDESRNEDDE